MGANGVWSFAALSVGGVAGGATVCIAATGGASAMAFVGGPAGVVIVKAGL
jgi:hypothetical protein